VASISSRSTAEGYELEVLKGAELTLARGNKPCVIVEQKPHKLGPNFGN